MCFWHWTLEHISLCLALTLGDKSNSVFGCVDINLTDFEILNSKKPIVKKVQNLEVHLPMFVTPSNVSLVETAEHLTDATAFLKNYATRVDYSRLVLAVDCEWQPKKFRDAAHELAPVSTLQLAVPNRVFVLDMLILTSSSEITFALIELFEIVQQCILLGASVVSSVLSLCTSFA